MRVSVAIAWPGLQEVIDLEMPEGSAVADALIAAKVAQRYPQLDIAALRLGIWSRSCEAVTALRDGDRVEIYRPLPEDPKAMRRSRARLTPSIRSRSGS